MAHAMRRAIEMSRDERIARHRALMKRVRKHDASHWMMGFLRALRACRGSPRLSLPRAAAGRLVALTQRRPSRSIVLP